MSLEDTAESVSVSSGHDPDVAFIRTLSEGGYEDTLFLQPRFAREVLTPKRVEILRVLADADENIGSVTALADRLDRNKGDVSRDLKRLSALQIVDFEQDGPAKIPRLKHRNLVVTPVLADGDVQIEREEA